MAPVSKITRALLVINTVVYFTFLLPLLLMNLEIYRFDYAVNTATAYVLLIGGMSFLIALIYKLLVRHVPDLSRRVTIISGLASGFWMIIFLSNRMFWASDSVLLSISVVGAFLLDATLVYMLMKEDTVALTRDSKALIIGMGIVVGGAALLFVDRTMWYLVMEGLNLVICLSGIKASDVVTLPAPESPGVIRTDPWTFPSSRAMQLHLMARGSMFMALAIMMGFAFVSIFWFPFAVPLPFTFFAVSCGITFLLATKWATHQPLAGIGGGWVSIVGTAIVLWAWSSDPVLSEPKILTVAILSGIGFGWYLFDFVMTARPYASCKLHRWNGPAVRLHGIFLAFFMGSIVGYWLIGFLVAEAGISLSLILLIFGLLTMLYKLGDLKRFIGGARRSKKPIIESKAE